MIAEIICVGTELLLGNILNTNAQYLSRKLAEAGAEVHFQTVVGDNPARIMDAVRIAFTRADTIILSGGLGPTKDDMTKEKIAEFFGRKLVMDEEALRNLEGFMNRMNREAVKKNIRKQALVPEGSTVLYNHHGTAPGIILEEDGRSCIMLPGPPKELEPMFEEYCMDWIRRRTQCVLVSMNIKLRSMKEAPVSIVGEAAVEEALGDLVNGVNPTTATYAKENGCLIRVTAEAADHDEAMRMMAPVVERIKEIFGEEYIKELKEDI
ncbi:MAG: CinA family nicotinamide mononucleotide deamidase-related protein [Solobacterium sp.]|nr:CinA family nicotinamide mononucleotide deamidase-related protein [Solobacterium sp.]